MTAFGESLFDRAALSLPLLATPLLLLGFLLWRRAGPLRSLVANDRFTRAALLVGAAAMFVYLWQLGVYLAYPGYPDHVQTTIAKMAFLVFQGRDLYPPPEGPAVYGMPYGPTLFLLDGLGTRLDPSIVGSKIPGVLALLSGLAGLFVALRSRAATPRVALLALFTTVLLLLPYGLFAYWNRPEPFLFCAAALAFVALRLRPAGAAIAVGLLLGLAAGIKLHGFLYLAPAGAALLGQQTSVGARLVSLLVMGCVALIAFLAPFALPSVSASGYAHYLAMAAGHGLDRLMLLTSLDLAAAILLPAVIIYFSPQTSTDTSGRWLFWGLLLAAVGVIAVAARVQAGAYHVLALIPACVYASATLSAGWAIGQSRSLDQVRLWSTGLFLALLAFWPGLLRNYGGISVVELLDDRAAMGAAMAELDGYAGRYPGLQMAVSDDDRYWLAMQDAPLAFRAGQLAVDYASWMDRVFVGGDRERLMHFIDDCAVTAWAMPREGEPFTLHSIYDGKPLFTDDFRRRFAETYKEAEMGRFYRVWVCRKG